MGGQISAILWAQRKSLLHHLRTAGRAGPLLSGLVLAGWYGMWLVFAAVVSVLISRPGAERYVETYLSRGLLVITLYWQAAPVLLASQGVSLDLRKLRLYPIPTGRLFGIEVFLRISTSLETLLVTGGLAIGLASNHAIPAEAAPAVLALFAVFNLLLTAGLRYQIERWLARRRLRELLILLTVLIAALPQLFAMAGVPRGLRRALEVLLGPWWPWSSISELALGRASVTAGVVSLGWLVLAWCYGHWQFRRNLESEPEAEITSRRSGPRTESWLELIYRAPSRLFSDPLAAIVEKEIRSLVRSRRFRLLFVMGFTFGALVFLPSVLSGKWSEAEIPEYRLTLLAGYALLLLGDAVFWNIFGADRAAAQLYFLQPLPPGLVIAGKNLVAGLFVFLEVTAVILVWSLLRLPVGPGRIVEVYLACAVLCIHMISAGNLTSIYYPRAVDPEQATSAGSAGTIRVLLLLILPLMSIPVVLAYVIRYVFHSRIGFYIMLTAGLVTGAQFYWFALKTAIQKAEERKERFLEALSASGGPFQAG